MRCTLDTVCHLSGTFVCCSSHLALFTDVEWVVEGTVSQSRNGRVVQGRSVGLLVSIPLLAEDEGGVAQTAVPESCVGSGVVQGGSVGLLVSIPLLAEDEGGVVQAAVPESCEGSRVIQGGSVGLLVDVPLLTEHEGGVVQATVSESCVGVGQAPVGYVDGHRLVLVFGITSLAQKL